MPGNDLVDVEYEEHAHETGAAHLFIIEGDEMWIPKSQMEHWDPNRNIFSIPEWLAEEKGLL